MDLYNPVSADQEAGMREMPLSPPVSSRPKTRGKIPEGARSLKNSLRNHNGNLSCDRVVLELAQNSHPRCV